jgi:hypothetical protein
MHEFIGLKKLDVCLESSGRCRERKPGGTPADDGYMFALLQFIAECPYEVHGSHLLRADGDWCFSTEEKVTGGTLYEIETEMLQDLLAA